MTSIIKAYYDGTAFIPVMPVDIPAGKIFVVSVLQEEIQAPNVAKQIAVFKDITDSLRKINKIEPLPDEFDEILSQRIHLILN